MEIHEEDGVRFIRASDNIFADLGFPDADELLLKPDLIIQIMNVLEQRNLSHDAAAPLIGMTPDALSDLFRGEFDEFDVGALLRMLNALDQNVTIIVSPKHPDEAHGHTIVRPSSASD